MCPKVPELGLEHNPKPQHPTSDSLNQNRRILPDFGGIQRIQKSSLPRFCPSLAQIKLKIQMTIHIDCDDGCIQIYDHRTALHELPTVRHQGKICWQFVCKKKCKFTLNFKAFSVIVRYDLVTDTVALRAMITTTSFAVNFAFVFHLKLEFFSRFVKDCKQRLKLQKKTGKRGTCKIERFVHSFAYYLLIQTASSASIGFAIFATFT